MKTNLFKVFNTTAFILLFSSLFASAQVPGSGARNTAPDTSGAEKINKIAEDAGMHFKEGLLNLQDNRRPQAREKFDKSVEVFLMSGVNVRGNQKLSGCYEQLVETIYLIEFPARRQPQIKMLAQTCGWKFEEKDNKLVDDVIAKINQPAAQPNTAATNAVDPNTVAAVVNQSVGFSEQKYEVSPLDELAKLELTPEEVNAPNTPEGQVEYIRVMQAVNAGSLGFKFQMHPLVQQFVAYYQGRGRRTMESGLNRSGMFAMMARRIFREEGIPENIIWLGQVESAWKPSAMSWASASGLWQFIPGTGSRYGLRRTAYIDERNSFEKATRASAQYLKFLANRYNGNWELALAGYNSGEGNVDRAVRRAGVANFWAAYPYLPQETRNYVPNILATILIANNPQKYGFGHVRPAAPLRYEQIRVPSSTSLGLVASAADTTVEYLRYLNPELRSNVTPPEPYVIRVPQGRGNAVAGVLKKVPGGRRNDVTLAKVVAGETLQNVANRTGVTVEELQAANGGTVAQNGKVIVPKGNNVKKTSYQRPAAQTPAPATGGVRIVKAQSGDTLAKIAARTGVRAVDIAKFNGLNSVDAPLQAGREIRIPSR